MTKYHQQLLKGMAITVRLSCIVVFFGLVFGTVIAFMKMSNFGIGKFKPLNALATAYIEVLRGTPLLLQLYFPQTAWQCTLLHTVSFSYPYLPYYIIS